MFGDRIGKVDFWSLTTFPLQLVGIHLLFTLASIGQVHRAILLEGSKVAVKVQYPGVQKSIDSDLDNLMVLLSMGNLLLLKCSKLR